MMKIQCFASGQDTVWVATVGDSRAILLDHRRVLYLENTPAQVPN